MDFSKDLSIEQAHRFVEFRAEQSTYDSVNGGVAEVNIDVPLASGEYMDMEDARLIFDLELTTSGSTPIYDYSASGWMQNVSVRSHNQTEIGNQTINYNRWVKTQKQLKNSTDGKKSFEDVLEGATNADLAGVLELERAHKLITNVFTYNGYYPVWAHKGFQLRIDLSASTKMGALCTQYKVKNLRLECRLVKLKPEVHNAVLQQLESPEGIVFDFESVEGSSKTLETSTNVVYQFGRVANRLKRVEVVESIGVNDNDCVLNNISSYRYRLGSNFSTATAIDVSATKAARHTLHYLRAQKINPDEMQLYGNADATDGYNGIVGTGNKFVMANQFDQSKLEEVISSADSKGMDLELHLTRSSTGTAGTVFLFKVEDRRLQILPGSQVQQLS
tara:strand:- start:796 stop:1965 length:1170 start_codon:yes stop_codon:yes gene_type:complete